MAKKRKEKWRVRRQSCEIEALEAEIFDARCGEEQDDELQSSVQTVRVIFPASNVGVADTLDILLTDEPIPEWPVDFMDSLETTLAMWQVLRHEDSVEQA